jgi:hypothetical protein
VAPPSAGWPAGSPLPPVASAPGRKLQADAMATEAKKTIGSERIRRAECNREAAVARRHPGGIAGPAASGRGS